MQFLTIDSRSVDPKKYILDHRVDNIHLFTTIDSRSVGPNVYPGPQGKIIYTS